MVNFCPTKVGRFFSLRTVLIHQVHLHPRFCDYRQRHFAPLVRKIGLRCFYGGRWSHGIGLVIITSQKSHTFTHFTSDCHAPMHGITMSHTQAGYVVVSHTNM